VSSNAQVDILHLLQLEHANKTALLVNLDIQEILELNVLIFVHQCLTFMQILKLTIV
jgi:hypothetical protein